MRRRALAVVATQAIGPPLVILAALIVALILLLAAPVQAQETKAEETTVLAGDSANRKVEAKTDNVSVEVDNGKVSVSTDDGSSSDDGTSQQSSLTVQQNQTYEGSSSRAATRNVNINQQTSTQSSTNLNGKKARIQDTDSDGTVDRVDISNLRSCTKSGGTVKVSVVESQTNGSTRANFTNGANNTVITVNSSQVVITPASGTSNLTVPTGFDPGTGTVTSSSGITCKADAKQHKQHKQHNKHNKHHNSGVGTDNGAAHHQYENERVVKETVIKETIPDKGTLADTGGVPLVGAALLALASVGLGLSILRFAIRRDP